MGSIGSSLGSVGGALLGNMILPGIGGYAGGALLGGSLGGKMDPNDPQNVSRDIIQSQSNLANQLMQETGPLRNQVIQRSTDFMKGGFDPTASAMYAPMKNSTEQQFNTAQDNLMSNLPQGGALFQGMANLQGQKAQSLSSLIAQIVADEYQKAYGMASGAPQTAGSIFAGAGQGAGNSLQSSNALTGSMLGAGANMYGGYQAANNPNALLAALLRG